MKEETVYHVDEHDRIIEKITRGKSWNHRLIHRGVAVLITNSNGKILVHKRSKNKKIYPGYYDIFFGGWTSYGETYKESAVREVQEELGIKEIKLHFLFKIMYEDEIERNW
ncbi:NUDIX domain-containing protein, partial [Candidatus Woesearchaeota archaeon]|nr:NUDIX domain-containing protein [Candidatus Woesearchaeota archaeon]